MESQGTGHKIWRIYTVCDSAVLFYHDVCGLFLPGLLKQCRNNYRHNRSRYDDKRYRNRIPWGHPVSEIIRKIFAGTSDAGASCDTVRRDIDICIQEYGIICDPGSIYDWDGGWDHAEYPV